MLNHLIENSESNSFLAQKYLLIHPDMEILLQFNQQSIQFRPTISIGQPLELRPVLTGKTFVNNTSII